MADAGRSRLWGLALQRARGEDAILKAARQRGDLRLASILGEERLARLVGRGRTADDDADDAGEETLRSEATTHPHVHASRVRTHRFWRMH